MRILITGASGFVGSRLSRFLLHAQHTVTGVARAVRGDPVTHPGFRFVAADTTRPGDWQQHVAAADAVINLAGRSIFGRWSEAAKSEIRESRLQTTRRVVEALAPGRAVALISASGVGYYGSRGEEVLTERTPPGRDFLASLSIDWESEALQAAEKGGRVVLARLGVVLAGDGGALSQMIPAFNAFVGGPAGDGRQWFPWIHADDLNAALAFLIARPEITGPVNLCAPNPARNRELAAALGRALKRPSFMPAPGFMLRLVLGEFAAVLLGSQRAVPEKLLQHGFGFRYPDIAAAVCQAVENRRRGP